MPGSGSRVGRPGAIAIGMVAAIVSTAADAGAQSWRVNAEAWDGALFMSGGASIGMTVRDRDVDAPADGSNVVVVAVMRDGPAEKAGFRPDDEVTVFDGERVRSARQFRRLVGETVPGRQVRATVLREGRNVELSVTPLALTGSRQGSVDLERMRERFDDLGNRFPGLGDAIGARSARFRLGVVVDDLPPQLADYFGAKDGVLITEVVEGSPASTAGLKAGDVITSVDDRRVASRYDLRRELDASPADREVAIGLIRDKREMSVKARLEDRRGRLQGSQPPQRRRRPAITL
jgi:serine protease Do